jgi:uncharacterized membrane protein YqjE
MSDAHADPAEEPTLPPADDGSIRATMARLVSSGRELAEAELAWARLKAAIVAETLRKWLILAVLALVFLMMGVTILIVSAIIALAPYVGWLAASLIVAGLSIAIAALLALAARRTFSTLFESEAP